MDTSLRRGTVFPHLKDDLRRLSASATAASPDALQQLVRACLALATGGSAATVGALAASAGLPEPAVDALLVALTDLAKVALSAQEVRAAFEEVGFSSAAAGSVADAYAEQYADMRNAAAWNRALPPSPPPPSLSSSRPLPIPSPPPLRWASTQPSTLPPVCPSLPLAGLALDRLVDLTWRLDYSLATREAGRVGQPEFRVALKLVGAGGEAKTHEFTCTPQELDDLRAKMREAVRAAEALVA